MGFWQGMNAGLLDAMATRSRKDELDAAKQERDASRAEDAKIRAEDRAFRLSMFEKEVLEDRRSKGFESLKERRQKEEALKEKLGRGIALGVTTENVIALQNSGQLDLFLDQYDKNKDIDEAYVDSLNISVNKYLGEMDEETRAKALMIGISTSRNVQDSDESYMAITDALFAATTPEELDAAVSRVSAEQPAGRIAPFSLNFGVASGPSLADTKSMRTEIDRALQPYFQDSFSTSDMGEITLSQNADMDVVELRDLVEQRARDMAFSANSNMTPTDAAADVYRKVQAAAKAGVKAKDIATNIDAVITNPMAFLENLPTVATQPAPVSTSTEEELGNTIGQVSNPFEESLNMYGRRNQ